MTVPTSRLYRGNALTMDYTPGSAVSAGDVVVQGELIGVAGKDIDANKLGDLQIVGPMGVWIFPITVGSGTGMTIGSIVYWHAASGTATATAGSNKILGKVWKAASATDDEVQVVGVAQKT